MRKLIYCAAIALLVPIGAALAALGLWWLTTDGNVSVSMWNRSHKSLDSVILLIGDHSEKFGHLGPGEGGLFAVDPRLTFDLSVAFDAEGTHHRAAVRTHALPFGDSFMDVSIDDQLRLTAKSKPAFFF